MMCDTGHLPPLEKINDQYASKTAINRGRVIMDWIAIAYKGNLDEFIKSCTKYLLDMGSVNIINLQDILLYMILGKLCKPRTDICPLDSVVLNPYPPPMQTNQSNTFNEKNQSWTKPLTATFCNLNQIQLLPPSNPKYQPR
ncbi:hypothetical protein O181_019043 [Austropuccinia psidii MF-1]|uniref:Uncharacterized protein n=1 Tax=Austropuccinia psidii MF-1 TaxID=1389203 RepID=A0A9Q3C8Y3_9BASI|nr:hypothetical protein [Austropuccinia psidii MF-1]